MPLFRKHTRIGEWEDTRHAHTRRRDVTVASATVMGGRTRIHRGISSENWQDELWAHYDNVGELRYASHWLAAAVSRCTLYIAEAPEDGDEPTPAEIPDAEPAKAALRDLHSGQIGQAEMLRRMALHLSVPGETFLVGIDPQPDQGIPSPRWLVMSGDEIKIPRQGDVKLTLPDTGQTIKINQTNSTIIRVWNPHGRRGWEADSPVRATLPPLREIKGLSEHIAASVDSRLAGAGILAIPHSTTTPTPGQAQAANANPLHPDEFTAALMEAMLTPIRDRNDASAVVPIVIKVPDDAVGKVQHLKLSTELSTSVAELRKDAINRLANGADLPGEVITGMGSMNHWGSWALEESSIKLHVEPLIGVICDALTQEYLWPTLTALGDPNPERWVVWYSSAELVQRPNRSAEAQSLYGMGALSQAALLRENGFSNEDAPGDQEVERWIAMKLALSYPDMLPNLLPIITQHNPTRPAGEPNSGPNTPPDTLNAAAPLPAPTTPSPDENGWWLRTVEQVALRALELAGKRMLSRSERGWKSPAAGVHPWDVHTVTARPTEDQLDRLLDGAYSTAQVNFADAPCVLTAVDTYCRNLLMTGQPHRREYLATVLVKQGCGPTTGEAD